jgi:ELWxxDGT repeat protein
MALTHIRRIILALGLLVQTSAALAIGNSSMTDGDFVVSGNLAYFGTRQDEVTELWCTDGTEADTRPVARMPDNSFVYRMVAIDEGVAFFVETFLLDHYETSLWTSDSTTDGTSEIINLGRGFPSGSAIQTDGSTIYFTTGKAFGLDLLWRSDLTAAGTALLAELPDPIETFAYSGPFLFFVPNNPAFYRHGTLWRTDGTAAGTIPLGIAAGGPIARIGEHDVLFESNGELWRNDGTPAGSTRVGGFTVRELVAAGALPYFTTVDGKELLQTDGTANGTRSLLRSGQSYGIVGLQPHGDDLYFIQSSSWWLYDAQTGRASDQGVVPLRAMVAVGNALYTSNSQLYSGGEIWIKRPGTPNLRLTQAGPLSPRRLVPLGEKVLFVGSSEAGIEPWVTDGTLAGTHMLRNIFPEARIQGTVVDGDTGLPLKDAVATASAKFDYRLQYRARTDANGHFTVDVQDGDYEVSIGSEHNDYTVVHLPEPVTARSKIPPQDLHAVLFAGGGISGRVVDVSGKPVAHLIIDIDGPGGSFSAWTGVDGSYATERTLPRDQSWVVRTTDNSGYSAVIYPDIPCYDHCSPEQGTRVTTRAKKMTSYIDFVVQPFGTIRGKLLDSLTNDVAVQYAVVWVNEKPIETLNGEYEAKVRDGGTSVEVWFYSRLHKNSKSARVVVPPGTTRTFDLRVDPLATRIMGRLVDARTSQPEPHLTVIISNEQHQDVATVKADANGIYRTEPQLAPGRYFARVARGGGWFAQEWEGGKAITVEEGTPTIVNADFQLRVRTMVSGVIRDSITGQPIRNAAVQLYRFSSSTVGPPRRTDENGRYRAPANPGMYIVKAGKYGWSPATSFVNGAILTLPDTDGAVIETNLSLTPACTTTLSAEGASFDADGGTGTFNVSTTCAQCSFSSSRFITLPASCAPSGKVTYSVAPNPGAARTGWILVPGGALKIEQSRRAAE